MEPGLVGRVLQQPAHQVRHAGDDRAHRNVDPRAEPLRRHGLAQRLGHAEQHLELDLLLQLALPALDDRLRHRARVVAAERRPQVRP